MIRVLQIGMTYKLGGIQTFLMNCHRNLDRENFQFDYINIHNSVDDLYFGKEILQLGGKIWQVPNYRKHPIKSYKAIKKIINENNYEIIHCNMNSAVYLLPLIAAKHSNAKVIIAHSHNNSSDKGILKSVIHAVNKHFIPILATDFWACSNKAGEWFYSKRTMKSDRYRVINNAIELKNFEFNPKVRAEIRKKLEIENDFVVGHVGRFSKQKNHEFLVDIFHEILKQRPDSKLILIGNGPLKNKIITKVNELNIQDKVKFLGVVNNVNEIMQAMDVFVLPSLYEGAPVVGVEAQATGLSCFFSDTITKEVDILEKTSYIDLNKTAYIWASTILETYEKNQRVNIKDDFVKKGFDIETEVDKLQNYYKNMINGRI